MRIYTFILTALLAAGVPLCANDVYITFDVGTPTLNPGQTFNFSGLISNNDQSTVDLNNIDVTLDGSLFQVDLSPFFSGPLTVGPEATTLPFTLFSITVDVPYDAPPGVQTGTVTILGGVEVGGTYDPTVQDFLGSAPFNVNVVSTPEPSTFAMISLPMLAGIGFLLHKRQKRLAEKFVAFKKTSSYQRFTRHPVNQEFNRFPLAGRPTNVRTVTSFSILLALAAVDAHANLLTNGSLDIPPNSAGSFTDYTPGQTGLTEWTIVGNPCSDVSTVSATTAFNGVSYIAEDGPG